jgi:hypothetical protein
MQRKTENPADLTGWFKGQREALPEYEALERAAKDLVPDFTVFSELPEKTESAEEFQKVSPYTFS